jgi:recombination DNA repair RAD52 pathway protein
MAKQSNPRPSNQSTSAAREIASVNNEQSDSVGQTILRLLHAAADETETDSRRSLETAQKLSHQLHAAQDRIAELEAEVRLYREKAERAEGWLSRISTEIEDRLIGEPEEKQRLH